MNLPDRHDRIMEAYYGKIGESFMRQTQKRINWICEQVEGLAVLDVGCSQGIVPLLLGREGRQVVGIDVDPVAVAYARRQVLSEPSSVRQNIEIVEDNFLTHGFGDKSFNTILITEVLEHVTQPGELINKAATMLPEGGALVVTVPFGINDFIDHKHTYYFSGLERLLAGNFEICAVKFFGEWIGIKVQRRLAAKTPAGIPRNIVDELEANFFQIEMKLRDEISSLKKKVCEQRSPAPSTIFSAGDPIAVREEISAPDGPAHFSVFIYGSCVSRDVLSFDKSGEVVLQDYFARSSFASAFHEKPAVDAYSSKIESKFKAKMVKADFSKELKEELRKASYAYLLVDFIDERFNLFEFLDGSVCTLSNELISAGFEASSIDGRVIKSGSGEFYALWESGWRKFISLLRETGKVDRVLINKIYWAECTAGGKDFLPSYRPEMIKEANQFLDQLYTRVAKDLDPSQIISFGNDVLIGSDSHRWGTSPFHYIDEYYAMALVAIKSAPRGFCKTSEEEEPEANLRYVFAPGQRLEVSAVKAKQRVEVQCTLVPPPLGENKAEYAFYLLLDGRRMCSRWYERDEHVVFDLPAEGGLVEVAAFAKDEKGGQLINRVEAVNKTA